LGITKRGDSYLRTLLIHGARSAILAAQKRKEGPPAWLASLLARKHPNVAAVALASRNARIVWALLAHKRDFNPKYGVDKHLSAAVPA
jgi:transposase